MTEEIGEQLGKEIPSRAREAFFEGDLRAWYGVRHFLAAQVTTGDLWETIPPAVRGKIAEVLEIYFFPDTATNPFLIVDGVELPSHTFYYGFGGLPCHKPRVQIQVLNRHASAGQFYNWGIRYRKKSPHVEGG